MGPYFNILLIVWTFTEGPTHFHQHACVVLYGAPFSRLQKLVAPFFCLQSTRLKHFPIFMSKCSQSCILILHLWSQADNNILSRVVAYVCCRVTLVLASSAARPDVHFPWWHASRLDYAWYNRYFVDCAKGHTPRVQRLPWHVARGPTATSHVLTSTAIKLLSSLTES